MTSYDQVKLGKEWAELVRALCESVPAVAGEMRQGAANWLWSLGNLALLWDHIRDEDPLDREHSERALTEVVFGWAVNPFWIEYRLALLPVMVCALEAWKSDWLPGQRIKAYDVATEGFTAVAYILGGMGLAREWSPRVRELMEIGVRIQRG